MKKSIQNLGLQLIVLTVFNLLFGLHSITAQTDNYNAAPINFEKIVQTAKPTSFWWWLNSLADKESITRDLEAFKAKGMGGVTLICSGNWGAPNIPVRGPEFLSPAWRELFKHAIKEAARLNLEVGVNFCASGWTMGGPWITPEMNGRWFVQSETIVEGPLKFVGKLPMPDPRGGYKPPYQLNVKISMKWPKEKMDYRDNAVVAFRDLSSKLDSTRLQLLDAKSNRKDGSVFILPKDLMEPTLTPWKATNSDQPIPVGEVIDLTSKLKPDGSLDWDVPAGKWTIVRTGHVATGAPLVAVLPEMKEGALAVDWLNAKSIDTMFKYMGDILIADAGKEHVGKTFKYLHTDSYEDGYPNWTDKLLKKFKTYRGYDPTPYLPIFTGRIVGSAEISDRFLYDYRKTAADLFADESLGRLTEMSHKHGILTESESAGPSWSGTVCIDALKNLGKSDRPMGEFWNDKTFVDNNNQNYVTKQTASAAHIYGKRIATAESFTDVTHWEESPEKLKPVADRAFCEGINRIAFHTQTLQRPQDGMPGFEYGAGTHFNPNVTWWNQTAGSWINYLSRISSVLQSGLFVGDVLFYNGDWAPNVVAGKHVNPSLGKGYDYDVCNAEVLLTRLSIENGRIVLPDGMSYAVLSLPEKNFMPVEVIKKIKSLVETGATVIGPRPTYDPGLLNYPQCDDEVKSIANQLWGNINGTTVMEHTFGKGRVVFGKTIREVLLEQSIQPDFEVLDKQLNLFPAYAPIETEETVKGKFNVYEKGNNLPADAPISFDSKSTFIDFIHRTTPDAEIYFLANRKNKKEVINAAFRVGGRKPELWNPVTGEKLKLPEYKEQNGRTILPLVFDAYDAYFIAFPTKQSKGIIEPSKNFETPKVLSEIKGGWDVQFDKTWLYPTTSLEKEPSEGKIYFEQLQDWTNRPEEAVKHYSGTAIYSKTFQMADKFSKSKPVYLDLGEVNISAKVILNGVDLGVIWRKPFRVDISKALKKGNNDLRIEVVNLWPNRLIGDKKLPENQQKTRTNMRVHKATSTLFPSGLVGPVTIQK
jgi:alpha-L-rhamnosidase